jgi:hypothetical protein
VNSIVQDAPPSVAAAAVRRAGPTAWLAGRWWEANWAIVAALALSIVPLLLPAFPPLVDVPGHIGRYHVAAAIARSADLQRHWTYHWALIGNLGVDLLVMPLQPLLGPVLAAKLVILTIPPLFVGGLIALSRACDGRQSPALAFAFPLAYGFPFQFGFVNFMLSAGLALLALALWIRWGRQGRTTRRAIVFVPIACGLWIAHSFGWGMFGVFAFVIDAQRRYRDRRGVVPALWGAALACVPLALPMLPMAAAIGHGGDGLGVLYNWPIKIFWVLTLLRERWQSYDMVCAALLIALPVIALRRRDLFRFDPVLGLLAVVALGIFVALPRLLMGGAYVDARMLGIAVALSIAAIRCRDDRAARVLGGLAAAFFTLRTVTTTIALLAFSHTQAQALAAVDAIPRGAAVLVIVNEPCGATWRSDRLEHVDGIAIARRDIFDNGQWTLAGQQLIGARHPAAGRYRADPSQLAYPSACEPGTTTLSGAMREFDRGTFDYVWTMDFPSSAALAPDVRRVWANRVSQLYRVRR